MKLYANETLLGRIEVYEVDQPWFLCNFEPTDAFANVKPLFDKEAAITESANFNEELWEEIFQKIEHLGILLVDEISGNQIQNSLLHIQGDKAWFRY